MTARPIFSLLESEEKHSRDTASNPSAGNVLQLFCAREGTGI